MNKTEYLQLYCFHDCFALHKNGTCLRLKLLGETLTFSPSFRMGELLKMMGEHFAWDPVSPVSLLNDY
jgi:hypothetical protein